jgi:phosphoglycolate phosphatase-like HAD superfamily hydrolase
LNSSPPAPRPIVAVDSDGTVLDAMTPKHTHAFTPALIDVWELQSAGAEASERFMALNLRSVHRGINRFKALGLFLRAWQHDRAPEHWPVLDRLLAWIDADGPHSEVTLTAELQRHPGDAGLARALHWSAEVNTRCAALPPPVPFPGAVAALRVAAEITQVWVVSGGNGRVIRDEWAHAGLADLARDFLTQEAGSKTAMLQRLTTIAGNPACVLMVGDSPLDEQAAADAGTAFFPIVPGREAESWALFQSDALPAFAGGRALPESARDWMAEFHSCLTGAAHGTAAPFFSPS